MFARIALILTLLLPYVSFGAVVRVTGQGHDEQATCCTIVETTTCCGETIVEKVCGMSDGPCTCVMNSAPEPAPAPFTPAHTQPDPTSAALSTLHLNSTLAPATSIQERLIWRPTVRILSAGTHNQQLALLGVWRT